ncbi:MAG: hypothetical protein GXP27_04375, partial [Planctomycetes bacterium]|nr:hypothetical protein [Planctomycetota bacterium]
MTATTGQWTDSRGGALWWLDGLLIVRHNQRVHREIAELLEQIREARA